MLNFHILKIAINEQLNKMLEFDLFETDIDKDILWNTYLDSFPPGTNEIFKERREYDCQCCKSFIKTIGNVIIIKNNQFISIWDIKIGGQFQPVVDALSKLVKSTKIKDIFYHFQKKIGQDFNEGISTTNKKIKWEHFYIDLPNKFVLKDKGSKLNEIKTTKELFKRGLDDITYNAINTVIELIEQKSIYRGNEFKLQIEQLLNYKKQYELIGIDEKKKDTFCWDLSSKLGMLLRIQNTIIGTLLVDISNKVLLNDAVKMFENKIAPQNYKRPSAIVTKSMIIKAQEKIIKLGFEDSLLRRFATIDDITINNILFADRSTKQSIGIFDTIIKDAPINIKKFNKIENVSIKTFITDILPKADNIKLMVKNQHKSNFMSLIAPQIKNTKNMFKWDNNFSWTYTGEVTDSIKKQVKKLGGNINGILRFSIQWNDGDNNQNDFDAHSYEPNNNLISFPKKAKVQSSSGMLDVDIITPGNKIAVENIIYTDLQRMPIGIYKFITHNYSHNGGKTGFKAEIEFDNKIISYEYNKELRQGEKVTVAEIELTKDKKFKIINSLKTNSSSKNIWNINTNIFQKVTMIMNSPNYWNENKIGNKHYFFILENCLNPNEGRGFYNEFLNNELTEHRKTMELIGSKMKTIKSNNQLSGVGFSSTKENNILCKVTGSFTRTIKINF